MAKSLNYRVYRNLFQEYKKQNVSARGSFSSQSTRDQLQYCSLYTEWHMVTFGEELFKTESKKDYDR